MQNAETVLGVLRERGLKGLPVERLYRQMFNRELYLQAYAWISTNDGALTRGVTEETADGMSLEKIDGIIAQLRDETYRWTPVRRTYIAKKHSAKQRPLGIPTWSNKLVQEVMRMLLEAYYEPQFSDFAHGFRPGRGCHTALHEIQRTWKGTVWFIEGDIKGCFDNINHEVLLSMLAQDIQDGRFLRLVGNLLEAGYLEHWKYGRTLSGVPQGGIVSPLLSNLYLSKLDRYVEQHLLPQYNRGTRRAENPEYRGLRAQIKKAKRHDRKEEARQLRQRLRQLPTKITDDPGYRRLKYSRYADDFLLGFIGPRNEAEAIKRSLGQFLREELKLEMSEAKTLITHAATEKAHFLGYELSVMRSDTYLSGTKRGRYVTGRIRLGVPEQAIQDKVRQYLVDGRPSHRSACAQNEVYSILMEYQLAYRGLVNYYIMAHNLAKFTRLKWIMEQSLTATLALKFQTSRREIYRRLGTTIEVNGQKYKVLQVQVEREGKPALVATWGGIPLKRRDSAILNDTPPAAWNTPRSEILERLRKDTCEVCGKIGQTEVHHVRRLSNLKVHQGREAPRWKGLMIARRRKKIVVCQECHDQIHQEQPHRRHAHT